MIASARLVALVLLCGAAGCSLRLSHGPEAEDASTDVAPDRDGWIGPDAAADAGPDGDLDAGPARDADRDTDARELDGDGDEPEPPCVGGGHDEDHDGVDDECDLCPSVHDPEQRDGDRDGLGDACEQPAGQDRLRGIAHFDPFVSYSGVGYVDAAGAYRASADRDGVRATTAGLYESGANLYRHEPVAPPFAVEATFEATENSADGWVGVLFAVRSTSDWWLCAFDAMAREVQIWRYTGGSEVGLVRLGEATDRDGLATRRTVRAFHAPGGDLTCTVRWPTGSASATVPPELLSEMTGGTGLRVYAIATTFLSFVIYE